MTRRLLIALAGLAVLAACGIKGDLEVPEKKPKQESLAPSQTIGT